MIIHVPPIAPDADNTVIKMKIKGEPDVVSNMPAEADGKILLPAILSDIHNRGYGEHAVLSGQGEDAFVSNWVEERSRIEWMFKVDQPGKFEIKAILGSESADNQLNIKFGSNTSNLLLVPIVVGPKLLYIPSQFG